MKESKQTERGYLIRMIILVALLAMAIGWMGVNFQFQNLQHDAQRDAVRHVATLQLELSNLGREATRLRAGDLGAIPELARVRRGVQESVEHLVGAEAAGDGGDSGVERPASGDADSEPHGTAGFRLGGTGVAAEGIATTWRQVQADIDRVLARAGDLRGLGTIEERLEEGAVALQEKLAAAADRLTAQRSASQVRWVGQAELLLVGVLTHLQEVLEGGDAVERHAEMFATAVVELREVLAGLLGGDNARGIPRVSDPQARELIGEVNGAYARLADSAGEGVKMFPSLFEAREAATAITVVSDQLLARSAELQEEVAEAAEEGFFSPRSVSLPGLVAMVLLFVTSIIVIVRVRRQQFEADQQREESEDVNKRTQGAILTLLDEMSTLADGDLTVKATVTEEITGAIADSVNYAIDELRKLVTTINSTSEQVAREARRTRATAINLAEASDNQAQQITMATDAIGQMADSIEQVSHDAQESADVAKRSVEIAKKGTDTVQRTILGMDNIREQIQETSKRIKRLGESSQEIGAIVGLINDIADQTNILALNAAIQAAMAGEAGRGFAVVADEVQRLAERSTDATKQIEALIKTIQTDTNEAVHSMEQSTSGVVAGAKLAEDAGIALTEIENVSNRLFQLVSNISENAVQQTSAAGEVSNTMSVIQDITRQVSAGTNETAQSIGHLADLANDLHDSVAGFKLPESEGEQFDTMTGEVIPELGDEAVIEPEEEAEAVSLAGGEAEELDLMAELSELHTAVDEDLASAEADDTLATAETDEELSAAVLEELAAELDASGETGLDVDLGAGTGTK